MNQPILKDYYHRLRRLLAKIWLEINPQLRVIGVTGSFGKTNTVRAITQVLSKKYPSVQTDLNLDTIYNLPITILSAKPWTEFMVLEMGVDHPGEMDFHLSLVKPQVAVVTGITPVHSDAEHLGSLKGIIKEKQKIIESLPKNGLAILNFDDENVRQMAKKSSARFVYYGLDKKNCQVWAENLRAGENGLAFDLCEKRKKIKINTGLIGPHQAYTCMVAYIVANYFGLKDDLIQKGLSELNPLPGRLSFSRGPLGTILLDDSLRANPASTIAGLKALDEITGKRKVAVLGEMGELGESSEISHRQVGQKISQMRIDYLVGIGPLTKFIIEEAIKNGFSPEKTFWAKDVGQAAAHLKQILKKGDIFYLKGSLLRHLERVIMILKGEKVACLKTSCHGYSPCRTCSSVQNNLK